jgi:hypothetical protein
VGNREELRLAIATWIERTYQSPSPPSAAFSGGLTPVEYETIYSAASYGRCGVKTRSHQPCQLKAGQTHIKHRLTAPYSATTTGKVERFHRTYRNEFLVENDHKHATIEEAQKALDAWVEKYNTERPHQSLGDRPPAERFALAAPRNSVDTTVELAAVDEPTPSPRPSGVSRWVDQRGSIGLNSFRYRVGPTFAGEAVEVVVQGGLVEILHKGVLVATHAERRRDGAKTSAHRAPRAGRARPPVLGCR